MDFSKFDDMVDVEGLKADVEAAKNNTGDFEDVPHGEYEVTVEKLELTESKKGDPMVSIWFKVTAGDNRGRLIFYNQLVKQGFQIHLVNELLASMEPDVEISFDGFSAYEKLMQAVFTDITNAGKSFHLDYSENNKGYNVFTIKEVFKG